MRRPLLLSLAALLASGCALVRGDEEEPPGRPLPAGWDTVEPIAFERLLEDLELEAPLLWSREAHLELVAALDAMEADAVRAALLLAHARTPKSGILLLRRLEKREEGPTRSSDAGDVVAAAAIPGFGRAARDWVPRLRALAVGPRAHPDLEVRVEVAASLLALGDDAAVPFLLQVLRIDTWAGEDDERDFAVSPHTAWARGRAAEALSRRAGVPSTYRPDGSIPAREREAARLERLLLPSG